VRSLADERDWEADGATLEAGEEAGKEKCFDTETEELNGTKGSDISSMVSLVYKMIYSLQ
jgi:hypothetical protein